MRYAEGTSRSRDGVRLAIYRARHAAYRTASGVFLGFAQAGNTVAFLPLAAFLEQFNPFKALQDVSLAAQCSRRTQTPML